MLWEGYVFGDLTDNSDTESDCSSFTDDDDCDCEGSECECTDLED